MLWSLCSLGDWWSWPCLMEGQALPCRPQADLILAPTGPHLVPESGREDWTRGCSLCLLTQECDPYAAWGKGWRRVFAPTGQDPSLTLLLLSHVAIFPQEKALFPEVQPGKHTRTISLLFLRHSFLTPCQPHPLVSPCPTTRWVLGRGKK